MAVHSRRPCDFLLLDRSERDRKEMEFPPAAPGFLDPSTLLFADGVETNPMKRSEESISVPPPAPPHQGHARNVSSLHPQPCSNQFPPPAALAKLTLPLVSTGLRLSFGEQQQQQNQNQSNPLLFPSLSSSSIPSSLLPEELAARVKEQNDEIDQFLRAQEGQLRRGLEERHRRHYRSLVCTARESAVRRLREKEVELEQAVRRSAELEDRLARLRAESMSWQAKAMAEQAEASSLHTQLQHVAAAAAARPPSQARGGAESADDAESVFEDSNRVELARACRACRERLATVVLLPCRHLCLCDACDGGGAAVESCPVCLCVKAGSVRVILA